MIKNFAFVLLTPLLTSLGVLSMSFPVNSLKISCSLFTFSVLIFKYYQNSYELKRTYDFNDELSISLTLQVNTLINETG
jgi:hypothetical protein